MSDIHNQREIENLQAEIKRLRADNDQHLIELDEYRFEIERLRAEIENPQDEISRMKSEVTWLHIDNWKLRKKNWWLGCELVDVNDRIEQLKTECSGWREMDDEIRKFLGGKRDGRNTLDIVKEQFTAKWDAEDHSYRLLLDSYTHPIIELLQAENERLRSALEDVYDQCSAWPFLLMTSRRVKTIIRAALEGK
jgi:chromosome segregation ATPase